MAMDKEQLLTQQDNYWRNVRAKKIKEAKQVTMKILQDMNQEQLNSENGNIMEDRRWKNEIQAGVELLLETMKAKSDSQNSQILHKTKPSAEAKT